MIPTLDRDVTRPSVVSLRLRKVLVVDDALPVRRALLDMLFRVGGLSSQQVVAAETPEQALEAFAKEHPSLIFTELLGATPADGLEMIAEMLRLDPRARIVLLTAEDPTSLTVRQAVRMGVFAVVQKPLRHEKVRQVLADVEAEEGGIERFR